ncbi:MAG TPA: protein kinase [Terriglobia bacterium]|nr:protein kinase [Terriglobia bacterium]
MSTEQTGQRIGDYEILGVLGAGGMGKVYKVRNVISDRIEAMKILLPDLAGQKDLADRFLREIKMLASLNHPNIASLRTALTVGNQLVMIMEFVEGTTLAARLAQGPIPPADTVDYIEQVLVALSYAHRQHIIHRDIKPANMMLTPQGLVKLMDFGIARSSADSGLTMTGTTLGSLYYMSPEQVKGEAVDARSDLYSVGVSLYELVTGRRPFQADSNYSLMAAHLQEAPKPPIELQPDLPAALNQIILMAMAKDPGQRFQSAEAFDNALRSIAASLPKRTAGVAPAAAAGPVGATSVFQEHAPGAAAAGPPAPAAAPPMSPPVAPALQPPLQAVPAQSAPTASVVLPGPAAAPPIAVPAQPAPGFPPSTAAPPRTYRGLYMTLGALLVVAVLALAAIYGPRWARTRASGSAAQQTQPAPATPPQTAPASPPAASPEGAASPQPGSSSSATATPDSGSPASGATAAPPAGGQPSNPAAPSSAEAAPTSPPAEAPTSHPAKKGRNAGGGQQAEAPGTSSGAGSGDHPAQSAPEAASAQPNAPAQAVDSAALDEVEKQMDQLTSRAGAVKDSIDKLRNEMSAQGGNLRGDINASEQRMETALSRAQTAFQNQDAKKAKQYLDQAETDVEKLEKFLNQR